MAPNFHRCTPKFIFLLAAAVICEQHNIKDILNPLKTCQFVLTSAQFSPMVQQTLKELTSTASTLFYLTNLKTYTRNLLLLKYSQVCVVHLCFTPVHEGFFDLQLPLDEGGFSQIHKHNDLLYHLADLSQGPPNFRASWVSSPCTHPLKFAVFHFRDDFFNDPPRYLGSYCPKKPYRCLHKWETFWSDTKHASFDTILTLLRKPRRDFEQRWIYADAPSQVQACDIKCLKSIPHPKILSAPYAVNLMPLVALGSIVNISGFHATEESQSDFKRKLCVQGGILKVLYGASKQRMSQVPMILDRYEIWELWYGKSLDPPNPIYFTSIVEPFFTRVWICLLLGFGLTVAYLLIRERSISAIATATMYVLATWFGHAQRNWSVTTAVVDRRTSVNDPVVFWTCAVSFFVMNTYSAILQSYLLVPGVYSSHKSFTELHAEGYEMYARHNDFNLYRRVVLQQASDGKNCSLFSSCQDSSYLRHKKLADILRPIPPVDSREDDFLLLKNKALLGPNQDLKPNLAALAYRLHWSYITSKDKYLTRPVWWGFSYMPDSDVAVMIFKRLNDIGLLSWVSRWCDYLVFAGAERNKLRARVQNDQVGGLNEELVLEALCLYGFGIAFAIAAFGFEVAKILISNLELAWRRFYWWTQGFGRKIDK